MDVQLHFSCHSMTPTHLIGKNEMQAAAKKRTPITQEVVKRVQRATVNQHNGKTPKDTLPTRLQSVFDKAQNSKNK